jgi:hypothetical protein
MLLHHLAGGQEERGTKSQCHRTAHHHQVEIEQVAQRRRSQPDQASGALHDLVRRL